jgi:Pyridoxamine 5'-phosphate oxidase
MSDMTPLTEAQLEFLETHHAAAMITVGSDGFAKVARVGIATVDGKLWSSGTATRLRTARLRDDPRCTLYVHDPGHTWLTLETTVMILDGAEAPEQNLQLFRVMQAAPTGPLSWFGGKLDEEAFKERMVAEGRLVYEFDVQRAYGMH